MIGILRRSPRLSLVWALFLLTLIIGGCGSFKDSDTEDPPQSDRDFSGAYRISEELNGCNDSLKIEYAAEVTQDGTEAQLKIGDDTMACSVDGDELFCSGELQLGSGAYRNFEEIIIRFEDDDLLEGTGTWVLYSTDSESCPGNSVFTIRDLSSDPTIEFSGTWDIHEEWQGCNKSGVMDYAVDIKQNGTEATLFVGNRSMDCTLNENELHCAGERYYDNGTYDHFSEYILRFNDDGGIEGSGSWTYHGTGENDCSGTSVFSLSDSNSDYGDDISFEGVYQLFLNVDDCEGYRPAEQAETYVIFQNGSNATFESLADPALSFDCQVIRGELQCTGNIIDMEDSSAVWDVRQLTFSYDSRSEITGVAVGTVYGEDGSECPGTYYFSTMSSISSPTASFSGTWDVDEFLLGCTTSITTNYQIEITEDGTNATMDRQGEIFDCTIDNNELICARILNNESGTYFEYSEYRLWFNENNLLDGIARWTLYEGDNAVCTGNSTISAAPTVSNSISLKGVSSGNRVSQYFLLAP